MKEITIFIKCNFIQRNESINETHFFLHLLFYFQIYRALQFVVAEYFSIFNIQLNSLRMIF